MPRIRPVTMDGLTLGISPLSWDEYDEYLKTGREMMDRDPKPTPEEWALRFLTSVVNALNRAAGKAMWSVDGKADGTKKITTELDVLFINKLHEEWLEMSNLRIAKPGEGQPTSTQS